MIAALVSVSAIALAGNPTSKLVVYQNNAESFKVIYEGEKAGAVTLKIFDKYGSLLFQELSSGLSRFMLPVNFSGLQPGEYKFTVTDATGTQSQSVKYDNQFTATSPSIESAHVARTHDAGKYLLSVTSNGIAKIHVEVLDENGTVLHENDAVADKAFGLVYSMKEFSGTPTFRITDETGKSFVK